MCVYLPVATQTIAEPSADGLFAVCPCLGVTAQEHILILQCYATRQGHLVLWIAVYANSGSPRHLECCKLIT